MGATTAPTPPNRIEPLLEGCIARSLDYGAVYRGPLAGKLKGERRGKRWFLPVDELDRLARERDREAQSSDGA